MKRINAASIVRDLRFKTDEARKEYLVKQRALSGCKHQPEPWAVPYDSPDPDFPFGLLCGTAYNANPMWKPDAMV